jgi:hypothetical protein
MSKKIVVYDQNNAGFVAWQCPCWASSSKKVAGGLGEMAGNSMDFLSQI